MIALPLIALYKVPAAFFGADLQGGLSAEIRDGKAVADAAKAANVQHFVYSSVGSAERNTGIPHFESKFQVEEYIRSLGLPYTILRPVFFFYNYNAMRPMLENGTLPQPLSPETKLQQLSEEDYGEMVAEVFDRPADFLHRELEVASVEMTMPEIAAAFSRVLGKPSNINKFRLKHLSSKPGRK